MTPKITVQVEELRARFDGEVRVIGDFENAAAILCTPRGCEPLRNPQELHDFVAAHPEAASVLPFWDDIHAMRQPFFLGLNQASFKTLDCELPALRAVQ